MPSYFETQGPYTTRRLEPASLVLEHFSSPFVQASIVFSPVLENLYLPVGCYVSTTLSSSKLDTPFPLRSWALLFAQASLWIVDLQARFDQYIPLLLRVRLRDRPRYRLIGHGVPRVDVCILTSGEDVDITMQTTAAAATQEYPSDRFEVFLSHDGESVGLRDAVEAFNAEKRKRGTKEVRYLSRTKAPGTPTSLKAGNLNFGLQETQRSSGAEFVASLDVDIIPGANWLRAVLPHLLLDEQVAMATPPKVRCIPTRLHNRAHGIIIFTTSPAPTFLPKVPASPGCLQKP